MPTFRLSDGRVVNPSGPLGSRLIAADTVRILNCTYCHAPHGWRGPWRAAHNPA